MGRKSDYNDFKTKIPLLKYLQFSKNNPHFLSSFFFPVQAPLSSFLSLSPLFSLSPPILPNWLSPAASSLEAELRQASDGQHRRERRSDGQPCRVSSPAVAAALYQRRSDAAAAVLSLSLIADLSLSICSATAALDRRRSDAWFCCEDPVVILGRIVDDRVVLLSLGLVTVMALVFTHVGLNVLVALIVALVACGGHAAVRGTKDLFLDESDAAEGGLLSVVC
ncbi:uncharacterized protein LOC130997146 [Salvia miltiorrhiza]|uniref:uncharacterized protein LOC130997146 n=1 Tax=Salvia miltiorrhiza TaxID=226208 RepID=UPI0025AC17EB|nr:uncharacterized protein LOC130997146 [Salvia miltiorrhiza]